MNAVGLGLDLGKAFPRKWKIDQFGPEILVTKMNVSWVHMVRVPKLANSQQLRYALVVSKYRTFSSNTKPPVILWKRNGFCLIQYLLYTE